MVARGAEIMKKYVSELAEGVPVDSIFALRSKEMRSARTGEAYLALELADRTGQISAVYFRPPEGATTVPVGAVVHVSGRVTTFRAIKRIVVDSLSPATRWDPSDLLARSSRAAEELGAEFKQLVARVKDPVLRAVLRGVFGDRGFFARFCECPGSQSYHHAYLGGLLEHTVAVARLCQALGEYYEGVDTDVLLAAALLHDVGKCDELAYDTAIEFTDEGRLLGHVALGLSRIRGAARRAQNSSRGPDRLLKLEHAVLSHHGELEWGSPKRPSTIEALLLHHADNLDAKAAGFSALLGAAARVDEAWTDSANLFRRPLWAPRAAEDERPFAPIEDAPFEVMSA